MRRHRWPRATAEGRCAHFAGLFALGAGIKLDRPALAVLGVVIMGAVTAALVWAARAARRTEVRLERRLIQREAAPSLLRFVVRSGCAIAKVYVEAERDGRAPRTQGGPFGPGSEHTLEATETPRRRGRYRPRGFVVRIVPFGGLAQAEFDLPTRDLVQVLPQRLEPKVMLRWLPQLILRQEGGADAQRGSEEFHALRPWRPGDSVRALHARASLKRLAWIVREEEGHAPGRAWIGLSGEARGQDLGRFDRAVSACAGLLARWSGLGFEVELALCDAPVLRVRPRHRGDLLDAELALSMAAPNGGLPHWPDHHRAPALLVWAGGRLAPTVPKSVQLIEPPRLMRSRKSAEILGRGGAA